jgi:hypothetical protein
MTKEKYKEHIQKQYDYVLEQVNGWHELANVLKSLSDYIVETYLCDYKLAFHLVYQRRHLIRMDICKLNSKSIIVSYSFKYETLTLFKRKVFQGVISLGDMIRENERRGYNYVQ